MKTLKIMVAALMVINIVLVVMLFIKPKPENTAYGDALMQMPLMEQLTGQVAGRTERYIAVTGQISANTSCLYLFDTQELVVLAVMYDRSNNRMVLLGTLNVRTATPQSGTY